MRNACLMWIVGFVPLLSCYSASAERFVWARGAVHFGNECKPPAESCRLAYVLAPNHQYAISVARTKDNLEVEVVEGAKHFQIPLAEEVGAEMDSFVEMEILWAPDSSAVSFAWSTSAITESSRIYAVGLDGVRSVNLAQVRDNFVRKWPPCVGVEGNCDASAFEKGYNYLTVAWASPHSVVLMAEVPSSSMYGANMGKVVGYEVDTETDKIVRSMTPREFKRRWRSRMGWKFDLAAAEGL